ncbi:MAG TPA: DUF1080 domain-containing protein, partial [Cytophagales bacterium]|nr:DUF1080 domain-containing protein [Cytophagales bacterium]
LTIDVNGKSLPAWLEMRHSGVQTNLFGRVMIIGGSARPISKIVVDGTKFNFSVMPQWEKSDNEVEMNGNLVGDKIEGTIKMTSGKVFNWKGERMPTLLRESAPKWGKQVALFNGKDMTGWHTDGANQWVVENGVLKSPKSGSNLISDQKFNDFKLHIEFRYPLGSNSGVYLRGRYEVQVTDGKGKEPWDIELSGVYGLLAPNKMVAKEAGEWQSFDITLVGRTVTIALNGTTVICEQVIPGITGGAIDSKEAEPGPFMIQGDHGPIEYRNILVTPAK